MPSSSLSSRGPQRVLVPIGAQRRRVKLSEDSASSSKVLGSVYGDRTLYTTHNTFSIGGASHRVSTMTLCWRKTFFSLVLLRTSGTLAHSTAIIIGTGKRITKNGILEGIWKLSYTTMA